MSFSGVNSVYLPPGTYGSHFQLRIHRLLFECPLDGGGRLDQGTFAVAGSQTTAVSGTGTRYLTFPASRSCATDSVDAAVTGKGKRAKQIRKVSLFVNAAKVRSLTTPKKGQLVKLPVPDEAAAEVRAEVTLKPANPGRKSKDPRGRGRVHRLLGQLTTRPEETAMKPHIPSKIARKVRLCGLAAGGLLVTSLLTAAPPAHALPVFTLADMDMLSEGLNASPTDCTTVADASPHQNDVPVAENGAPTSVSSSVSGNITNDGDATDVISFATSVSATGRVTSVGGNPGVIELTNDGHVHVATSQPASACAVTASSRVPWASSSVSPRAGSWPSPSRASRYTYGEINLNQGLGEPFFDVAGQGLKLSGTTRLYLPPGTYAGFYSSFTTSGPGPRRSPRRRRRSRSRAASRWPGRGPGRSRGRARST